HTQPLHSIPTRRSSDLFVERRRGRWEQSDAYFNRAERLDPRNVRTIGQHAVLYKILRRFPDAVRKYEDVLNITPDDPQPVARQADRKSTRLNSSHRTIS